MIELLITAVGELYILKKDPSTLARLQRLLAADVTIARRDRKRRSVTATARISGHVQGPGADPALPAGGRNFAAVDLCLADLEGADLRGVDLSRASLVGVNLRRANLGTESAVVPIPHLVFTTSATLSGTLSNSASVSTVDDITDIDPDNNVRPPVVVTITSRYRYNLYLPLALR